LKKGPADTAVHVEARSHESRLPQPSRQFIGRHGLAVGYNERRRAGAEADSQSPAQVQAPPGVGVVGEVCDAARGDLLGRRAIRQQRLAQPRLAGDKRFALKELAQGVQLIVVGLARKRPRETFAARDCGVDLLAGVVVLQPDFDPADVRQPAHDVARVGCHQVRKVGSALRRRQPEQDLHVATGGHLTGGHEPKRGDWLIELGIVDIAQRLEDARPGVHGESTSCASSFAAGVPASSAI
jgi:hypothetical protein